MMSSDGHLLSFGYGVDEAVLSAFDEDVEAEVAASFGPFVVLLSQDGADQRSVRCDRERF